MHLLARQVAGAELPVSLEHISITGWVHLIFKDHKPTAKFKAPLTRRRPQQTIFANGRKRAKQRREDQRRFSFIVIRNIVTTTILLAALTVAACAQDVPVAPKQPVAAKQEDRKAEASSSQRLAPDPNKFAVIISGIGGDEAYSTRFAKWAGELRAALVERLGFAEERVTTLAEKPSEEEQPCSANALRDVFGKLRSSVKPDNQVFIFFIGHGSFDGKI